MMMMMMMMISMPRWTTKTEPCGRKKRGTCHSIADDRCRVLPLSIRTQYWLPLDPRGSNGPCEVNTSDSIE